LQQKELTPGVAELAFSPSGTALATSDFNGNTYLWNIG
jgi:hypothetical protein